MKLTKVRVSKEEILRAVPGLSWDDVDYSPSYFELDAEVVEEDKDFIAEHSLICSSFPHISPCSCPCHSKSEENNKEWRRYDISAPTQKIDKMEKFPEEDIVETAHLTPHAWNKLSDKINQIIDHINSHGK